MQIVAAAEIFVPAAEQDFELPWVVLFVPEQRPDEMTPFVLVMTQPTINKNIF